MYPGEPALPLAFPHRRFRLWSYVPSHSELVLRTEFQPGELHTELLFKPVYEIKLPVSLDGGLIVDVADQSARDAALRHLDATSTDGRVFTITAGHVTGYVVADYVFLRQELRSRYSPFSLFHGYLQSDFSR